MNAPFSIGGIVLCGGRSSRMGQDKGALPFGDEPMLPRVVRLLRSVAQPLVVVAAHGETPAKLPANVLLAQDQVPNRGPLEGLRAGLAALPPHVDAAFVTTCDAPLLVPEFVQRLAGELGEHDIAVPVEGERFHPLTAVYRQRVLPQIETLLAVDRLRPVFLFELCPTVFVPADSLRDVDPQLTSLLNLNRPDEYLAALAAAGLEVSPEVRASLARAATKQQ